MAARHSAAPWTETSSPSQAMHVSAAVASGVVEYLPALQSVHISEPVASAYFPSGQPKHALLSRAPALDKYFPVLQEVQVNGLVLDPGSLYSPGGQHAAISTLVNRELTYTTFAGNDIVVSE